MTDDWTRMTASDLGRGIGRGEIDPVELATAYLDAIKSHAHRETIYARWTEERALAEAAGASARARAGTRRSLLDGVPISWKDLYDTAGVLTEAGSALLKDRKPQKDARVVDTATAKGLVCLGKTHMTELAFSGLGVNPVTATPPNINTMTAAPGGSSSGAAASVAFGLAAAGIGSDTGGSVRVPAAWNDLVGLKTTHGNLSLDGVVQLCAQFDTVGPLCRSVEDAAQLYGIMGNIPVADLTGAGLEGARLLVCETTALDNCDKAVVKGFQQAVKLLSDCGADIKMHPVQPIEDALALAGVLYTSEAYATWGQAIEAAPNLMYDRVRERFESGKTYSAVQYIAAWHALDGLRQDYTKITAAYDAVLVPTSPSMPPDVQKLLDDKEYYDSQNLLALRNTRIGNLFGLCALTLPTSVPSVGLMLMGAPNTEARLLRLGQAVSDALEDDKSAESLADQAG